MTDRLSCWLVVSTIAPTRRRDASHRLGLPVSGWVLLGLR